jgi:hypothetical protein
MMDETLSNVVLDVFKKALQEDEWNFRVVEGEDVLQMGFEGDNGRWDVYIDARTDVVRCYSVMPVKCGKERLLAAMEYITRVNFNLPLGNFEMDLEDGEVRFKTSVNVEGLALTEEAALDLLVSNVVVADRYLSGLMSVVFGGASPEEAVEKMESAGDVVEDEDE